MGRVKDEIAVSEAELSSMTRELDMLHTETLPAVRKAISEFSANMGGLMVSRTTARRSFLMGVGGAAVVGGVAACSSSGGGSTSSSGAASGAGSSAAGGQYTGDLKVVALAAALENLAITAYQGALTKAGKGELGTVPPAVVAFVQTAMKQHQDHADAWNGVLRSAKLPAVNGAPLSITKDQVAMLNAATSVPDVAKLALALENVAAETYTLATTGVQDVGGIMTAATIQPVEAMHAAILSFVLGEYPVPVSFIGTAKAVSPDILTA